MEKNLSKDEASDNSNWNPPQSDNPELNPLSQLLLGRNTPLAGSPYSSTSEQEDKLIAMGALFQLQQQQHPQLQQQQQELQQQQQHLQQQQQHLQQPQPHQLLQQHLDDKQSQAIDERQQLHLIQEQQRHERDQQEKQQHKQNLMQLHQMQQQNLDSFRIIESAPQEEDRSTEKRYQSTISVLESAGLLDITLKTSELAQKNEAFEKDLSIFEEVVRATYNAVKGNK